MTAIILINWNGADDTLACLQSLLKADGEFFVVVVDNASADDSVVRLNSFAEQNREKLHIEILALDDNYGFAVGNNKAIQYAIQFNPTSYMLLNNDTEVEPDFLTRMVDFSSAHPEFRALTPQINYYSHKSVVWECGGDIKFGKRKKYYADALESSLSGVEYFPVTFISGCAIFFYPELLNDKAEIFTDRFFFGEEDFEFSLRMKRSNVKMAAVVTSKIYHKVGQSRNKMKAIANVGKYYMYYLNRLITLKLHLPKVEYKLLKWTYIPNIFRYFNSVNKSVGISWKMILRLMRESEQKEGVNRADFQALMIDNNYFDKN